MLLKEFTQTLYSVADDVYMNVEFNPEYVKEYRLIGFDNKVGALRDASSVVEGGEIGSGFSMIALFEIEPTELNRGAIRDSIYSGQFANIRLQYRNPGDTTHRYFDKKSSLIIWRMRNWINVIISLRSLPSLVPCSGALPLLKPKPGMIWSKWPRLPPAILICYKKNL